MDAEPPQPLVIGYATAGASERRRRPVVGSLCSAVAVLSLAVSGVFAAAYGSESRTTYLRWSAARRATASRRALTPVEIDRTLELLPAGGCNAAQVATLRQLLAAPGQEWVRPANVPGARLTWGLQWDVSTQGGVTSVMFAHDWTNREVALDAAGHVQRIDVVSWATGERSWTTFGPGGPAVTRGRYFHASMPVIIAATATAAVACGANFLLAGMLAVVGVLLIVGNRRGGAGLRRYARLKLPVGGAAVAAMAWMFYASSVHWSFADMKLILLLSPGVVGCLWAAALFRIGIGRTE